MCGILGTVGTGDPQNEDAAIIRRLMRIMWRRGPDDEGLWSDQHCTFGFRRLAVIDPTPSGHQPMLTPDGRYVLVYNGEVYNFVPLRAELEGRGVRFQSNTDTEVVLHALAHWGEDGLRRFNGIFALAFYDTVERRLLLARDPIGVKPLYYLAHRNGALFASQYDQILKHPWSWELPLDPSALQLYLRLGYVPPPRAMLAGTEMLLPGHAVVWTPRGCHAQRSYYSLPEPPVDRLAFDDAVEEAEEVLSRAVHRQLVSDVPLGVFLSGGIDSPLVAALAQEQSTEALDAFTISSEAADMDESATAQEIAQAIAVRHHVRRAGAQSAHDLVARTTDAFGEPFADHSSIPTLLVSEVARERLVVALSGDGGDEIFFGYPRFRKVLQTRSLFGWPQPARIARYAAGRMGALPEVPAGVRFENVGRWYLNSHAYWSTSDLKAGAPSLEALPDDFHLYDSPVMPGADGLADWLRRNEMAGHLQRVLLKVDRASMHHHLEVRVPLLDLDVIEFAMRVAPSACMNSRHDKAVLRSLLARRVPLQITEQPKKGFTVPLAEWLRGPLRDMVNDLLLTRDAHPAGVFDRSHLVRMYEEHLAGADRTLPLWCALALQLWWERHYAKRTCA